TDASGNMQWSKTYGGANDDVGYSVQQTSDGGYVIAGETMSYGSGGWNVYLVKTDASGNMQWQKWYGGSGNCGYSVVVASDGGYVIAAQNGLIKTDMSGNSPPYSDVILYEGTALIPVVVYTVLHDPPGSDSFTWLSNTVTTSCETTLSAGSKSTVQVEAKADFLGNGVDASQSVSVTPSTTSSDALVVSSTQALSSSNIFDDPWYIGPGYGDVVAGEAWLLHYRVVDRTYPNGTTATVLDYGETREASHVLAAQFFVTTTWIRNHVQEPWRSKLLAMDIGRDNFIHDEDQGNVVDYGPYLLSGGIPIDNSSKVTGRSTKSSTFDIEVSSEVAATCGFEVEGIGGASGTVKVGLSFSTGITQETATEREKEIGYHLYDHKGNDTLSMELYYDKVFGTYMFLTSPGTWTSDPQEYTPIQHRVGVTNANCAKTVVCQSFGANMSVSVDNSGANDENVNVTVYAGSTPLVSQIVPMPSQSCTDLVFNLDTAGLAKANYTLSACAWVPDQNDTLDNNFTGGWIIVSMVGDLTGGSANVWDFVPDGKCDGKDISVVAKCFGSYPGCSPPLIWNANCDVNNDGKVDGKDIATVARHLGE
ncbi:MAG: dockerin type I domain-containing protein, partial [Candidatus Bathyarchaeia archaeon]